MTVVHCPARLWRRDRLTRVSDAGTAIVEFVFVALLVMIPLVYLIVAVAQVQRDRTGMTQAARDVGRAIGSATSPADARTRSDQALTIALRNDHLTPDDVEVRYVGAGQGCGHPPITPPWQPGGEFAVCVIRQAQLPAVPSVLDGRGITVIGRFVVHLDDFRGGG